MGKFLLLYLIIIILLSLNKKKASNKFIFINLLILLITFICFSINNYPASSFKFPYKIRTFDLYRYYWQMDLLRKYSNANVISFVFEKVWFGFRLFELFVSKVTNNNYMIVVFSLIIIFFNYGYILLDLNKKSETKFTRLQTITLISVFLSIVNSIHLLSGLRNSLACSIFSVGIYNYWFKGKKKFGIFLILFSITVHPMILIFASTIFLIKIFSKIKHKRVNYIFLLILIIAIIPFMRNIILTVGQSGLLPNFITEKLDFYSAEKIYYSSFNIVLEVLQLLLIFKYIIESKKNDETNLSNFLYYNFFINLCFILISTFFVRIKFADAFLLPIIFYINNKNNIDNRKSDFILLVLSSIIFFRYLTQFLKYF